MRTLIFVLLVSVSARAQTATVGLTSFSPIKPNNYLPAFGSPKTSTEITAQKKFGKRRIKPGVGLSFTKAAYANEYFSESVISPYAIASYNIPIKKFAISVNAIFGAVSASKNNMTTYNKSDMFGHRFGGYVQADYKVHKRLYVSAICGIYRIKLDNWVTTTQKSAAIGITIK